MIKYIPEDTSVVFSEIPDEITLAVNISNCTHHCPNCHSPYLREDIGEELTVDVVKRLLEENKGVTCLCLMGEGNDPDALTNLAASLFNIPIKLAIYSGREKVEDWYYNAFDFIKIGSYIEELGPLNKKSTNQRLYKKFGDVFEDITYRFWGESFKDHEKAQYIINPEKEELIKKALEKKEEKFGKKYCPCVLPKFHSDKTICPCENYRMTGKCHCGLYNK